jgi:hypothetical protein
LSHDHCAKWQQRARLIVGKEAVTGDKWKVIEAKYRDGKPPTRREGCTVLR